MTCNKPDFPFTVNYSRKMFDELAQEEYGSWEDYGEPEPGVIPNSDDGTPYGCEHAYNICMRNPFEIRNRKELDTMIGHVLDNSIDKAQGWAQEYQGDRREHMKCVGWLGWLKRLQRKLEKIRDSLS